MIQIYEVSILIIWKLQVCFASLIPENKRVKALRRGRFITNIDQRPRNKVFFFYFPFVQNIWTPRYYVVSYCKLACKKHWEFFFCSNSSMFLYRVLEYVPKCGSAVSFYSSHLIFTVCFNWNPYFKSFKHLFLRFVLYGNFFLYIIYFRWKADLKRV